MNDLKTKVDFLMRVYRISYLTSILEVSKSALFLWKHGQAMPGGGRKEILEHLYAKAKASYEDTEKFISLKREANKKTF